MGTVPDLHASLLTALVQSHPQNCQNCSFKSYFCQLCSLSVSQDSGTGNVSKTIWMGCCLGLGGSKNEKLLLNGYRVPVLQDEKEFWGWMVAVDETKIKL